MVEHTKETVGTEESSSKVEDPLAFYQRVAEQKRKKKRVKKERREGREGEGEGMEEEALEAEDGKRAVTYQVDTHTHTHTHTQTPLLVFIIRFLATEVSFPRGRRN